MKDGKLIAFFIRSRIMLRSHNMNPDWKTFLSAQNTQFTKLTNTQEEMLFDLSGRGLIKVSGEDAESFLQNQLSNDIKNVTETAHQASAWCSPKGRIIVTFQIFKRADCFYLSFSADLLEHVIKKLRMYVMMSKVVLEDVTESVIHFGYAGELQKIVTDAPSVSGQMIQHDNLSILRIAGDTPRYEAFSDILVSDDGDNVDGINDAKQLWEQCAENAKTINNNGWDYLNILAGLPDISEASSEAWIPQMVNYIAIGGVDFKKGCYPGQEVVARLNYLGKTKRRMYRLQIDTDQLPDINESITSDSDKAAGKILNVAINPAGKVEALAILKIAEADKTLMLSNNTVEILELPYSLDE